VRWQRAALPRAFDARRNAGIAARRRIGAILTFVIHRRESPNSKSEDPIPELKRQLAQLIVARVDGWSQVNAASLLGTDQPRVSDLRRGRLERFSLEQLLRFVSRVDGTARITVEWSTGRAYLFAPVRK